MNGHDLDTCSNDECNHPEHVATRKHEDYCTLLKNVEDRDILTRKLFDVNMRLFKSSPGYRDVVLAACEYIRWCSVTEKAGYKKPHGYSGANAGIPFNIIAIKGEVMINPHLKRIIGDRRQSKSNCGSLLLPEPIDIWRWGKVVINYYDMDGNLRAKTGYLPTEQHEIDHNKGILITDRRI